MRELRWVHTTVEGDSSSCRVAFAGLWFGSRRFAAQTTRAVWQGRDGEDESERGLKGRTSASDVYNAVAPRCVLDASRTVGRVNARCGLGRLGRALSARRAGNSARGGGGDQEQASEVKADSAALDVLRTLPNVLTVLRVAAIPLLMLVFCVASYQTGGQAEAWRFASAAVFGVACITDFFDGWLARKLNAFSDFGAFLDPVADKLMVATALILLTSTASVDLAACAAVTRLRVGEFAALAAPTAIIISREIGVSALREWMAKLSLADSVKVGLMGKLKTTVQMLAIAALLHGPRSASSTAALVYPSGIVALQLAALLTVLSGVGYIRAAVAALDQR